MAIGGISILNELDFKSQNPQNTFQQTKQGFQQLGKDLQSGNLSAAQSDLATLLQSRPQSAAQTAAPPVQNAAASGQSGSAIAQDFAQLSTDLQAGNLSGAQADYTSILQAFQNRAAQSQNQAPAHAHRHHGSGNSGNSGNSNSITQEFSALGQALQAGNLSSAKTAYTTLQQDFELFASSSASSNTGSGASASSGISLNA
ncbi:MAG TPA: hypothetical protein VGH83_04565 [Candidatus Acidoferrum sp.]|jgi:hypothetical protein